MQLRAVILLLLFSSALQAQDTTSKRTLGPVDVDFIFTYYDQDGNHSAVTGGTGTEKLEDIGGKIMVYIPVDSVSKLNINAHVSHYSSASSDNINSIVSSASAVDNRFQIDGAWSKEVPNKQFDYGFNAGLSIESDYISFFTGGSYGRWSKNENRMFSVNAMAYIDRWVVIFKEELRDIGPQFIHTDKRRTFSLSGSYVQVINKRLQGAVLLDVVYQYGLLSTPFHSVYFTDTTMGLEVLPDQRVKLPIGLRLNYFAGSRVIFRLYYRYYWDTWQLSAHTLSLEIPVKIGQAFSIYPIYRFYYQTAAQYFQPYAQHDRNGTFHTSDYDLSTFNSHKYGGGIRFTPLYGRFKKHRSSSVRPRFRNLDIRVVHYRRSDGLKAIMFNLNGGFTL